MSINANGYPRNAKTLFLGFKHSSAEFLNRNFTSYVISLIHIDFVLRWMNYSSALDVKQLQSVLCKIKTG